MVGEGSREVMKARQREPRKVNCENESLKVQRESHELGAGVR